MEKSIIRKMRESVKNENMNVQKDFNEDRKDLRNFEGNFLWGYSEKGTNLICYNVPFSYLQIENMKEAITCYACIGGHMKKVSRRKALSLANGLYSRNLCA